MSRPGTLAGCRGHVHHGRRRWVPAPRPGRPDPRNAASSRPAPRPPRRRGHEHDRRAPALRGWQEPAGASILSMTWRGPIASNPVPARSRCGTIRDRPRLEPSTCHLRGRLRRRHRRRHPPASACSRPASRRRSTCHPATSPRATGAPTHRTFCEWKGPARYFDLVVGDQSCARRGWTYDDPDAGLRAPRRPPGVLPAAGGRVPGRRRGRPGQRGRFYGGWITAGRRALQGRRRLGRLVM